MSGMLGQYIVLVWLLVLTCATDEQEKSCVNHPPSKCPVVTKDQPCYCQRIEEEVTTIICCDIPNDTLLKSSLTCAIQKEAKLPQVTALQILNSTFERLDMAFSYTLFQNLIGISVTNSNILHIRDRFPSSITCLNLSSNHLEHIEPAAFSQTPLLRHLDLSNNNLTYPPKLDFRNIKTRFLIDLSDNIRLPCTKLNELRMGQQNSSVTLHWLHQNNTYCTQSLDYQWFKTHTVFNFSQLDNVGQMENDCPKGEKFKCRCGIIRNVEIVSTSAAQTHYYVDVDCSGQGLTELPKQLPAYTIVLNISNNNITDLDYLGTNPHYKNVMQVDANNNRIKYITVLEGSEFIEKFTGLSLRNNNIREIPKYMLSNVFDRTNFKKEVKLGMNWLPCDCSTAQVLKAWLLANKNHISDYDELLCENFNNMKVVDLDQALVCVYPRDWTDYIYYIIAIEILLFVLMVSKVSYDYWVFKTTGSLPWPASKMPRLPCDWVFEL